ncbi:hypothetical protein LA02_1232 [Francisella philomiragia]|nr:hypothetical protein LA02_1232 [Francisella philomiragia]
MTHNVNHLINNEYSFGLRQLGNTCFFNLATQLINRCIPLKKTNNGE